MADNFAASLAAVWEFDGIKDDEAAGEKFITTWGITAGTYEEAIDAGVIARHPQSLCTPADAKAILLALYWNKASCPELPSGVELMTFNMAMLGGVIPAIRVLQYALSVEADGVIGPVTLNRAGTLTPLNTIKLQYLGDLNHLRTLGNWNEYQDGWTRRENVMVGLARKLASVAV